jgi:hypothetical protein
VAQTVKSEKPAGTMPSQSLQSSKEDGQSASEHIRKYVVADRKTGI